MHPRRPPQVPTELRLQEPVPGLWPWRFGLGDAVRVRTLNPALADYPYPETAVVDIQDAALHVSGMPHYLVRGPLGPSFWIPQFRLLAAQ